MSIPVPRNAEGVRLASRRLLWLGPPVAALLYPYAVMAFYQSGRLLDHASDTGSYALAWVALSVSAVLTYGVPALSLAVACHLGRLDVASAAETRARRFAHLAFASPSLFVLIGVVFYLLHVSKGENVFWWILWLAVMAAITWSPDGASAASPASTAPSWLRTAHGVSALAILAIFLAWHLMNHMSALVSPEINTAMMKALRKWYRSEIVQPVLVALVVFQVLSGLRLLWAWTTVRADLYRTMQTATGAFLAVFITSHLNAVFVLGRAVSGTDTTFAWASGAPTGLLPDAWNVRLIPHYSLAVWLVITHIGLGLRGVLLGYRVAPAVGNRVAWAAGVLGAVVTLIIITAQMRVYGPRS